MYLIHFTVSASEMHRKDLIDISKINAWTKVAVYNSVIIREPKVVNLKILREKKMLRKSPLFSSKQIFEIFRVRTLYLIQSFGCLF